jgi:hypothetical protein
MGYDMYLIKADINKLKKLEYPLWQDVDAATLQEVNSYYPVLRDFYQSNDELHWTYEEYNVVTEETLTQIIAWLKNKIDTENFGLDSNEERMTKMVYRNIKDWLPLKENEVIYFEEDS